MERWKKHKIDEKYAKNKESNSNIWHTYKIEEWWTLPETKEEIEKSKKYILKRWFITCTEHDYTRSDNECNTITDEFIIERREYKTRNAAMNAWRKL